MNVDDLALRLRAFARDRDWEQFHAPKNLAMALAVEIADVFIYTVRLADRQGIDLEPAVEAKIRANAAKYPVEKCRGSARKYSNLA